MLVISEERRLSFLQLLGSEDPALLETELGLVAMSAQMEGIASVFDVIQLDPELASLRPLLTDFYQITPRVFDYAALSPAAPFDLAPQAWEAARRRQRNQALLRRRLTLAGLLYLVIIALAIGYVMLLKQRLSGLDRQLAETRPRLEKQETQQRRWDALAPAVLPERSVVEVLHQVIAGLPAGTKVTQFDYTPQQFMVAGESGTASEAIAFTEALRNNQGLRNFTIESGPPTLVNGERAQFKIFGKI